MQGLFLALFLYWLVDSNQAASGLLRQKAARDWMEATELNVGAYRDWLIGNHPHRRRDVATAGRITLSGQITDDQCVRREDWYSARARLPRVGRRWISA